ncbi:MAG: hypothetical protein RMJ35_12950, partial [Phycisphaerales bacterium]|nr:hypothetical protein [Phycisphaerales bacterium]
MPKASFISAGVLRQLALLALFLAGCVSRPTLLPEEDRVRIDRKVVEYPAGFELTLAATGLTTPAAFVFDAEGSLLVAENGENDRPRIIGWRADGSFFQVYPRRTAFPLFDLSGKRIDFRGPIGGMVVSQGRIYVSHRDSDGSGVITAFDYDGSATTIVSDLPAKGDYGVTDLAVVGVRTRGVPLARRIAAVIARESGTEVPTGALDITLYRDDLMRAAVGPQPLVR